MATGKERQNYRLANRLLTVCLVATVLILSACNGGTAPPSTTTTTPPPTITTTTTTTTPTTTTLTTTTTTEPGVYEIYIYWQMSYSTNALTVPVGSTVTFILVNGNDPLHPVGFSPGVPFSISGIGNDLHLTYTFTKPSAVIYYCTNMRYNFGLLVIESE